MLQLNDIAEVTKSIASDFDIERIYLFGSYARNEATEASDIDLCLETGSTFSLFNAGAFVSALEDSLNIPIDMVSQDGLYEFAYKGYLRDRCCSMNEADKLIIKQLFDYCHAVE